MPNIKQDEGNKNLRSRFTANEDDTTGFDRAMMNKYLRGMSVEQIQAEHEADLLEKKKIEKKLSREHLNMSDYIWIKAGYPPSKK